MISNVPLTIERLRTEKRYLSDMIIKLIEKNQQLLRECKYFRVMSQHCQQNCMRRTWEMEDGLKVEKIKEIKHHQEEMQAPRLCQRHRLEEFAPTNLMRHRMTSCDATMICNSVQCQICQYKDLSGTCFEDELIRNAKEKIQILILEKRVALLEQEKDTILENSERKINHLHQELKTCEQQATLLTEELKKYRNKLWMYEVDRDHLGSPNYRVGKRSYVCLWQKSRSIRPEMSSASFLEVERPEADTEDIKKTIRIKLEPQVSEVPEDLEQARLDVTDLSKDHQKMEWLEASKENLRRGGSQASIQNVREGLQAVMSTFSKEEPEAFKQNLPEWLEARIQNISEECPEESRKDMKEWFEISKHYFQEKEPEKIKLNAEEWVKESITGVQDLQERSFEGSTQNVQEVPEDLEQARLEVPEFSRDHLRKRWQEASIENLRRGGSQASIQNVQKGLQTVMSRLSMKGPEASKQKLTEWLEESIQNLPEECPEEAREDMKEWFEISKNYFQEKGPEMPKPTIQEWLEASIKSIEDLQGRGFEGSTQNVQEGPPVDLEQTRLQVTELPRDHLRKGWLEASIENLRRGGSQASIQNVQEGLQAVMSTLSMKGPAVFKQNLTEWLEDRVENVSEECPKEAREDMKEWFEISKNYFQEKEPEMPKPDVQEWLEASMRSIEDLQGRGFEGSTQNFQGLPEYLDQTGLEVPGLSREKSKLNVGKRLYASMSGIQELQSPEVSKQNLQVGVERVASTISVHLSIEKTNLLEQSLEEPSKTVHEWYRSDLIEDSSAVSQQNVGKSLQLSSQHISHKASRKSMDPESRNSMDSEFERMHEVEPIKTPSEITAARELQTEGPRTSTICVKDWLEASKQQVKKGASGYKVQEWLETAASNLGAANTEASKQSLQEWIEESMRTLNANCPKESKKDVQEWLQTSLRKLQEASIKDLSEKASRLTLEQWLLASLLKLEVEDPESSREDVKGWLESSLREFTAVRPDRSGLYVKEWLEGSLSNLKESKQNLQEYMKESLMHLKGESFTPLRSRYNMDSFKVPERSMEARVSKGILKREPSRAHFDRRDPSRTSLTFEENEEELDQEEVPGTSQEFITSEAPKGAKEKWLRDQAGTNTQMIVARVSKIFRNRTLLEHLPKILLVMAIPVALLLTALTYRHFKNYCLSCGGLQPY